MPRRPRESCTTPGCPGRTDGGGRCARCRHLQPQPPADSSASGVYTTRWWRDRRLAFLSEHALCVLCGAAATVADHYPLSRRVMVAAGVTDPDADDRLRALCKQCHDRSTAARQPGGWNRDNQR